MSEAPRKPTLHLPGAKPKVPKPVDHQPDFGGALGKVIHEEIARVGRERHALFDAVMRRILGDEELFRYIAKGLLHRTCRKRIKNVLHDLAVADQARGTP